MSAQHLPGDTHRHDEDRPSSPTWLQAEATIAGRLLIIGVAAAALLWIVLQVQFIAMATVIGFAIVSLLWPVAKWLRSKGVPAVLAALLCVLAFLAFFTGIIIFVVLQVIDSVPRMVRAIEGAFGDFTEWLNTGPFGLDGNTFDDLLTELQSRLGDILGGVSAAAGAGLTVVGILTTVLLIAIFFAIFALTSGDKLWHSFAGTLADRNREPADAAFLGAMKAVGNWFYASTITGLVDGGLIGIGLAILGVPLAIPIGALTFILAYVPLVGATLAGAVAVIVAFFFGGFGTALWALVIVLVVQQIEGNVLSPLLLSRAINFHPLIILLLTTTAATAFGLIGLFLAIPVTGAITAAVLGWRRKVRERDDAGAASESADDSESSEDEDAAPDAAS